MLGVRADKSVLQTLGHSNIPNNNNNSYSTQIAAVEMEMVFLMRSSQLPKIFEF